MEDEKRVRAWRNVTDTKKRSNEGTREESQGVNLLSREGNSQTGHMMTLPFSNGFLLFSLFFYFYILEELYLMVHTFIIQILGFQEFFFSSS